MLVSRRAFTLVELLIVVAILAILAAILFPVYTRAIASAKQVACMENFQSTLKGNRMYMDEYDDRFPPANYHAYIPERVDPEDRTWVQLLTPYVGSIEAFFCPGDTGRAVPAQVGPADDVDAAPSDDWGEFYIRSLRSNMGYNYVYLSPVVHISGLGWQSAPTRFSQLQSPAKTLVHIDSVWGRDANGVAFGGGQWIVVPPCRYWLYENVYMHDTFPDIAHSSWLYVRIAPRAWESDPKSGNRFGGAWPWHNGRFTVGFGDAHVAAIPVHRLTAGCDVQEIWGGLISDRAAYLWDLKE